MSSCCHLFPAENIRAFHLTKEPTLGDLVNVQRPQWKNIEGTTGMQAMPRAERR